MVVSTCLFLINNLCRWKMHFIRSEFRGLLPGRFNNESVTKVVENFNDQNKEELDKYVSVYKYFKELKVLVIYKKHLKFINIIIV